MLAFLKIVLVVAIPLAAAIVLLITRSSESISDSSGFDTSQTSQFVNTSKAVLNVEPNLENKELDEAINKIIEQYPNLDTSVAVQNINTAAGYSYGDNAPYFASSVTKLVTATAFLHSVEQDKNSLSQNYSGDTADNLLKKMIYYSDNEAWIIIRDAVTNQNIDSYAYDTGLTSFKSYDNLINSSDMVYFLSKLYTGQLLSPQNTQYLLGLMSQADQNYPMDLGLPAGATAYHKYGWLPDRLSISIIIEYQGQAVAITVFSKTTGDYNFELGEKLMKQIVQATLASFV